MKIDMKTRQRHRATERNTSVLTGGVLLTTALALAASGCKKAGPPATPPPVVQVMEVAKKNVPRSTTFIGQLDSPQNVEVRARVEAFLDKILFEEGSEVQAGDPLFELDKKPYEEKLAAAKGVLAEAKAALTKSSLEVPRLTALVAQKAAPQKDLDTAVAAKESNEANVASAEARVKSAELDLGYCDVKAPIGGAHRREGGFGGQSRREGRAHAPRDHLAGRSHLVLLRDQRSGFSASADRLAREAGRKMGELPVHLILSDGTEHPEPGKWVFVDRVVDPTTATIRGAGGISESDQGPSPRHVCPGSHQPADRARGIFWCRSARSRNCRARISCGSSVPTTRPRSVRSRWRRIVSART